MFSLRYQYITVHVCKEHASTALWLTRLTGSHLPSLPAPLEVSSPRLADTGTLSSSHRAYQLSEPVYSSRSRQTRRLPSSLASRSFTVGPKFCHQQKYLISLICFNTMPGVGLGMILQQPIIVVQATAKSPADIPQKTAIVTVSSILRLVAKSTDICNDSSHS